MGDSGNEEEEIEVDDPEDLSYDIDISGGDRPVINGNPPDWFTGADAQILFVMYTGLVLTPSIIAENTNVTRQTVSKRLDTLRAAGYVEKLERGKYKITKDGSFIVSADPDIYRESTDADSNDAEE
jgi:DNA-binding transcriptional ArsR family regulator